MSKLNKTALKPDLFAREAQIEKLKTHKNPLEALELINFEDLAVQVDEQVNHTCESQGGRPRYPTVVMLRILMIQKFYCLSDEQMEYQLLDRHSFQATARLTGSMNLPNRNTIWNFRQSLSEEMVEWLFEEINKHIRSLGYEAKKGHMVDASLIKSPKQHLSKEEKQQLKEGNTHDWKPAKKAQTDADATWTKKHGKYYHGYKITINADTKHKLIQKIVISTASKSDTEQMEDVLDVANTSKDVYADRGYVNTEREKRLNNTGYRMHIQRKKKQGKPLSECQKKRNTRIARTRARVEHVFAQIHHMKGHQLRSIGIHRATVNLTLLAAAHNIKRLWSMENLRCPPTGCIIITGLVRPKCSKKTKKGNNSV